jgi:glycosyltransferase involved in cell wall biosynthesis
LKILLLNQTFYPDVVSTAQHLTDLALALKEQGHEVTVVASRRGYDNPDALFPTRETWRGIEIRRISSTRFGKKAKWRRAMDFASFLLNCCLRLLFLPKQDVVVALTSPPLISFLAAWFTKLRGGKLCYWVMDLNPDEAIAAGWLNRDSLAGRWLERFSRFSFRSATRIIALDRFMRDRIVAKGIAVEKISVIPPWSHDDHIHFDPAGRERFRARHGLQDKFVVMYSGNHSPCHPLDTLLDAARQISTLDSQLSAQTVVFCFVGGGSEFKRVQAFKKEHALNNILCLPYQPLEELSGSLSAADLQVVAMGNPFVGIVHPCKIYNILTIGAPVLYLGPAPSHVAEILAELNADYPFAVAQHGDISGMVGQIQNVREQLKTFSPETPAGICRRFSRAQLLPQMVAVIAGNK